MDILNEKIEGLVKKAEKSGMPYGILKKVYDRGMAAWRTGHRPGTTPQQWAFARVNSFVTKSSGTWGGADKDLAKKVRGEEVEKRKTAKDMIGQVKEKLGKDADAGDFIKDFRKSKAPQFKGKSDKKIQKMAIAAYLDSKEEKDLDEENLQELINFDRQLKDPKKETMVMFTRGNYKGRGFVIDKKDLPKFERQGAVQIESNDVQESGHTDVPSMKTQVQIAMDALQKMNTELGKLSDEDELPTWWTNKVATAVNKLDGMADYIDAKHDQGQKMNESNLTEQTVFVVRFEKEGMRFATPFYNRKNAEDGRKILQKSKGVSNISVTKDILKPGIKLSSIRGREESKIQEGKILPESKMGAFFLDMQIDANEMSERDFIKKYQGEMGMTARELKDLYRQMTEEVVKEAVAQNDAFVVTGGPGDNAQKVIAVFKDKGNGLKDAKKARDDYNKKNKPTKATHKARIYRQTRLSQAGQRLKPGEQIKYSTYGNKQQFTKLKEDVEEVNLQEGMSADTAKAILKMRAKDKFEIFRGDYVPMIYLSNADRDALKDAGHKMTRDIPKPTMGTTVTGILNVANGSSKSTERAGMYDTETDDMKGKNPAVINMKKFVRGDFQKVGYPKTVGDLVKMTGLRLNSNDPSKNEEVHPMVKATALATTVWAERRHIDPADVDVKATAADRKAADKNIIIQLRRAQDMEKQTGRADQSGIEFLDKKKQKVDPKIINKALDMFDKMKPNDKQKMQQAIGKSYRDLLKTVQRGRV